MKDAQRLKRQQEIEKAAYELLEAEGYEGISVLKIAKKARASNETLYRWYGNKQGLFKALVESNAETVKKQLLCGQDVDQDSWDRLAAFGPDLLSLLTGERAVALNRAAAGDVSGLLGQALSEAGREAVFPLVLRLFEDLLKRETCPVERAAEVTDLYIRLLVGDWQIRRATRAMPQPTAEMITARNQQTLLMIRQHLRGMEKCS